MKGKYYGVYDIKDDDAFVGIFESIAEIAAFFGGIRPNRIECAICRNNPLAFGAKRYKVEVYKTPTRQDVKRLLRRKFGMGNNAIRADGIYVRENGATGWRFFAGDFDEVVTLVG